MKTTSTSALEISAAESGSAPSEDAAHVVQSPASSHRRRFPRVYLELGSGEAPDLKQAVSGQQVGHQSALSPIFRALGARGGWEGGPADLLVCDISYTGIAFLNGTSRATLLNGAGVQVRLKLNLAGERQAIFADAVFVRQTDSVTAFDFLALSTQARLAIERFLQAKLIGLNLRPVDARYFAKAGVSAPGAELTHWFQGPGNCNVLLWFDQLILQKAIVEIGTEWLHWTNDANGGVFEERSLTENVAAGPQTTKLRLAGESEVKGPLAEFSQLRVKMLEVLMHVPDHEKVLRPFIQILGRKA